MNNIEYFSPMYQLQGELFNRVSPIAGKKFNNHEISIDFDGICNSTFFNKKDTIQLRVEHIGINGHFYLFNSEIEREFGISVKLLSPDYVEYIIMHNMGHHGIKFERTILSDEMEEINSLFMTAKANFMGKTYSIFFDINQIIVDNDFLFNRQRSWPELLTLSVDLSIASTLVDVESILDLSNDDIVVL